jgi:phospholipase/carboxylesterase
MKRVIFLHGVGSSGDAMRPVAAALGLTDQTHCPDGVLPFEMGPGRQWFSVRGITEENRPARVAAALPAFAERLAQFGPLEESVLVGFSQGAIMSLHAAAAGAPVAGVIAIAGRLAAPVPAHSDWPTITLLHGDADPVIPVSNARATQAWLKNAGADTSLTVVEGLGHSIDARMIGLIRTALQQHA